MLRLAKSGDYRPSATHKIQSEWSGDILGTRILDQLEDGIIVLDPRGVVKYQNASVGNLAGSAAVRFVTFARPRFSAVRVERAFFGALRDALHGIRVKLYPSAGYEWNFTLMRTGSAQHLSSSDAAVLLTWRETAPYDNEHALSERMRLHSLTTAEERLTRHIVRGGSLSEASEIFGVSLHTVRNQLRSIFEKVGIHRQTDLTRIMLVG